VHIASLASAFLRLTSDATETSVALRALTLHMLEAHAPEKFRQLSLSEELQSALQALRDLPLEFPVTLGPDDAMSRIDALYILRKRNLPCESPDPVLLKMYLGELRTQGYRLHAWLLGEMAESLGLYVRQIQEQRPFHNNAYADAYWLTHLYFLATEYLHRPLPDQDFALPNSELLAITPWIIKNNHLDLGAEVAICLQISSQMSSPEQDQLLQWLSAHVREDGRMPDDDPAHCTAAALLAFAGSN
jgi:hypothetical protein